MQSTNKHNFFTDVKKYSPLLKNLVVKDIKLKYRRSALGIAWSVLNPLFTMLVLTQVFGMLLKIKVANFATYYIVGFSIWSFFSEATTASLSSVINAAPLIKKVYIPKYVFPLEKCLFSLVNFAFSLIAVLIVMIFQGVYPTFYILLFFIPVIYTFIFVCGMCLFLSAATVFFRDIEHLYGVLLTVWMYLTPIIYPLTIIDSVPGKIASIVKRVIYLNPLTHFVEYFRCIMMHSTEMYSGMPGIKENIVCLVMSLIVFVIGAFVFNKAQKKFILYI
ncbi:MAG: ABC transporter permease [Clostridia bacterium]|nr:ABC transporter permease [Clostridia bacterium]